MSRLLIFAIIFLLAILILYHNGGQSLGLGENQLMRLSYLSIIALVMAGGLFATQRNFATAARNLAVWAIIILGLVVVWLYKDDARNISGRMLAALNPGHTVTVANGDGFSEVILYKSDNGHYEADASINGKPIAMMVDTGATGIALTYEDAQRLGLDPGGLSFDRIVMTANGPAKTAMVKLDEVAVGAIRRRNVQAGIAQPGRLDKSLLGMNFLETLSSVTMAGDELRLKD